MREKRATPVDNHAKIHYETQDSLSQHVHILSTTRLLPLDALPFQQVTFHLQDSTTSMISTDRFEEWHRNFLDQELHLVLDMMI